MNYIKIIIYVTLTICVSAIAHAQKFKTDAHVFGHVVFEDEHIPFASISIMGTTIGTSTDETGHFRLINLPIGKHKVMAQAMGYKPLELEVTVETAKTIEVNFSLEKDVLGLKEFIVSSDRNKVNRQDAMTIVSVISPKLLSSTQSITISEGLNFCPGLRTENKCQNCGFNQVRMNGLEGPYSQILINSRPIFSSLAGVYGLELIPANMIERIEVIRGGGSALFGSNAIAGTINLILKDPIYNSYELSTGANLTGVDSKYGKAFAEDYHIQFNSSLISSDAKTGMSMYAFFRDREAFDANADGFSELPSIHNISIGSRFFHRFGTKSKIVADFFSINENRRGGNKQEMLPHEADIAEAIDHQVTTAALTFERFMRKTDLFSIYASAQKINRNSYYGAEQSLSDYGATDNLTYISGAQYTANFPNSKFLFGVENNGEWLKDVKLGYLDVNNSYILDSNIFIPHVANHTIADQKSITSAAFTQYEIHVKNISCSAGLRFDHYSISDKTNENSIQNGSVFSPRLTMKYDLKENLRFRMSYSQGFRAPQIFDEDLHIETSGSRQVIHVNDPNLTQENSRSFLASIDYNRKIGSIYFSFLLEGFYTKLINPFANEFGTPDSNGVVIYTRVNAENGALVQGVNMELNIVPSDKINITSGFTIQSSQYEEAIAFNEKSFFRTPAQYGYMNVEYEINKKIAISTNATYTGKMLIPYFGTEISYSGDAVLRQSKSFFDAGLKMSYNIVLNGATLQIYTGVKNILNSYQSDFDSGINRDPGYIYGPAQPRSIYFGLKIGNKLK